MARYDKEHKLATRARIIETAGRRLKQDGVDGSGIATLMKDAGLTNGAFYAHFESKDQLVASVVADQVRAQAETFAALPPGREGLVQFVQWYLSPDHRDGRDTGCPSAALLDEIVRCNDEAKQAYTDGARDILDEVAVRLSPRKSKAARQTAIGLFAMMVGTLQLARAVSDPEMSDEVLAAGVRNALAAIG